MSIQSGLSECHGSMSKHLAFSTLFLICVLLVKPSNGCSKDCKELLSSTQQASKFWNAPIFERSHANEAEASSDLLVRAQPIAVHLDAFVVVAMLD